MRPSEGFKWCDYKSQGIYGDVSCDRGYLRGTSDYDHGMKSLAYDPKMAARQPCPKCHGNGEIRDDSA